MTERVSIDGFGIRMVRVRWALAYDDRFVDIVVDVYAERDRERPDDASARPIIGRQRTLPQDLLGDREAVRHFAREVILEALAHEVDEWLVVDGERIDPHRVGSGA
jgi:hypothetical protein